jgi:hypothetical protein
VNRNIFAGLIAGLSMLSLAAAVFAKVESGPFAEAEAYFDQDNEAAVDPASGFKLADQLAAQQGPEAVLWRVRVLSRALEAVTSENREQKPIAAWLAKHKDELNYSEPSGQYYLLQAQMWDLYEKYKDTPLAEDFAWEAANTLLGGECEGYLPCYTQAELQSMGRYLELYPRGQFVEFALEDLYWMLEIPSAEEYPLDANDKAITKEILDRWDKVLAKVPKTEAYRQGLVKIAKEYGLK